MPQTARWFAGAFVTLVLVTSADAAPPAVARAAAGPVYAGDLPPAPRVERAPAAPGPGWVWLAGHWAAVDGEWRWQPGRWALPPAEHVWLAPSVASGAGVVVYLPGRWVRQDEVPCGAVVEAAAPGRPRTARRVRFVVPAARDTTRPVVVTVRR